MSPDKKSKSDEEKGKHKHKHKDSKHCADEKCKNWDEQTDTCAPCDNPVNVVVMWHMHQPQYEDQLNRQFFLPWTYLHCIKDYSDMANVLEECPHGRAVVNFSATLLNQIDDYCKQFDEFFQDRKKFGDALLNSLSQIVLSEDIENKKAILTQCLRANETHLINRYPQYAILAQISRDALAEPAKIPYLHEQFYFDLMVWYHLAWMGETIKLKNKDCQYLIKKASHFNHADRLSLLQIMRDTVHAIIPGYRQLANEGRIELSFTPENHPILPLLLDFENARQPLPDAPLPHGQYPGGEQRANAQIKRGIEIFESHFGHKPHGCWPSEGAVCEQSLKLLEEHGISWAASGMGVLHNSLHASKQPETETCIHHGFRLKSGGVECFFRDDNLSDLIGFTFHNWAADDAVNHLIHHIENIQTACGNAADSIVPIILDGENCWEYYPANGHHFLKALYTKLGSHHRIRLTTFNEYLCQFNSPLTLKHLVSGSWVNGNLATWIGDTDKNRGWELLVEAKKAYDITIGDLSEAQQRIAEEQLSICESSDWFWWFGDYNAESSVSDFDRLYRLHLKNLYKTLGLNPPESLETIISHGRGDPEMSGTMRRGSGGH